MRLKSENSKSTFCPGLLDKFKDNLGNLVRSVSKMLRLKTRLGTIKFKEKLVRERSSTLEKSEASLCRLLGEEERVSAVERILGRGRTNAKPTTMSQRSSKVGAWPGAL